MNPILPREHFAFILYNKVETVRNDKIQIKMPESLHLQTKVPYFAANRKKEL